MNEPHVTEHLKVSTVTPCCCCKPSHEQFYKVYTIILIVFLGIQMVGAGIHFGSGEDAIFTFIINLLVNGLLLGFIITGYSHYQTDGNYGNTYSYCYALTVYICSWVAVVLLILTSIFLIAVGASGMMDMVDSTYQNLDQDPMFLYTGCLVFLNIIILPASLYMLYLSYLYCSVISKKKREIKDENKPILDDQQPEVTA